jgi:hypothetical protein
MADTRAESGDRRWFPKFDTGEFFAWVVLLAAFLPLTIPDFWAVKWRNSLIQLILWLALFGNRRLAVWVLIPFYLAMPVLVFVCRHFGPPNLDLLGSVRDSLFTTVLSGERQAFFATIPAGYYFLYFLMLVPVGALVFFWQAKTETLACRRAVDSAFDFNWNHVQLDLS